MGVDGHQGGHLVDPSLDLLCMLVGQCYGTLGPAQGTHVLVNMTHTVPPVAGAVQGWKITESQSGLKETSKGHLVQSPSPPVSRGILN